MNPPKQKSLDVFRDNPFLYFEDRINHLEARIKYMEEGRESEEQGTIREAMKWSGMGHSFIYKQCAAGKFPHHHTEEGRKYFIKSEVKTWKKQRYGKI